MLDRIVSGGQTGADQHGLFAARAAGIATGGWSPLGWRTESGPAPWLADYGLREHASPEYPPRTEANVLEADATLWFGRADSAGYWCTRKDANRHFKPFFEAEVSSPAEVTRLIRLLRYKTINVAGNRASSSPGIGNRVEQFLAEVFALLKREVA